MYQQSKSAFLVVTLNFELIDISNRYFQSDFAYSFDYIALHKFYDRYQFVVQSFSLVCALLRKHPIYNSKTVINISRYGGQNLECPLIIFIYFNLKFKVTCRNKNFECRCIKAHFEKKKSKICTSFVAILLFFLIKILQLTCHPG